MKHGIAGLFLMLFIFPALAVQPGVYYDPDQGGHGVTVLATPDGDLGLLWYTYAPAVLEGEAQDAAQVWFIADPAPAGEWADLYRPLAYFPASVFDLGDPVGAARLTQRGDLVRMEYQVFDWPWQCAGEVLPGPSSNFCRWHIDLERLAGL